MRRARLVIACLALSLAGCERGLHEMYEQPKYKPLTPTELFADGNSSRPQVAGTIAYSAGALAGSSSGRDGDGAATVSTPPGPGNPLPITAALLERGRERFNIYCAPCHSMAGDGDGMIARRGFPSPPSYHTDRLRNATDSHFYDVITNGYGVMYSYADRIAPQDRWAIVAYIRALQLSQHAPASALSDADLGKLREVSR
ncbi:MAG TPA: cytochrome c [Steroidobacteraceae bacterium]